MESGLSMKREYFPNNWQQYKDSPDEMFIPHRFDELMDWKVTNWELPYSVSCIIRARDRRTNKVSEYVFQRPSHARNKIESLLRNPDMELAVCDHAAVHHLFMETTDD